MATTAKTGAIKLLATGTKEMVVKIPAINTGSFSSRITTKIPRPGGLVSICCDVLSCSVK